MDYDYESEEIVDAIGRMAHGYERVNLRLFGSGIIPPSYTSDELYSRMFDLSLKSRIGCIYCYADDLYINLGYTSDGGTNITPDVIEKIDRYLGHYCGQGPNFLGEHTRIEWLLKDYKKYLKKNRRIVLRDVSWDNIYGNMSFSSHDLLEEFMKSSGLWGKLHLGVGYPGGHEKFIVDGGHVQLAGKDCFVIQISDRKDSIHDLVEDWRWECLFRRESLPYPFIHIWRSKDYVDRFLLGDDLGMP